MPSPKHSPAEKIGILGGKGRLNPKNPLSKKEQQKGSWKTSYKGNLIK
jgi:hypothetical protein